LLVKPGSLGKHIPVFCSFRKGSSEKLCPSNQPWSYSFARARVLQALADSAHMSFADFTDRYGLHSLRSGGATLVAKEGVPDHIFQAHAACRSSQAMHAYIERPIANNLLPTRAMHYWTTTVVCLGNNDRALCISQCKRNRTYELCETPELRFLKRSRKWDVLTFWFSPVSASLLHSFYSLYNTTLSLAYFPPSLTSFLCFSL
jgi:hypothetical protein